MAETLPKVVSCGSRTVESSFFTYKHNTNRSPHTLIINSTSCSALTMRKPPALEAHLSTSPPHAPHSSTSYRRDCCVVEFRPGHHRIRLAKAECSGPTLRSCTTTLQLVSLLSSSDDNSRSCVGRTSHQAIDSYLAILSGVSHTHPSYQRLPSYQRWILCIPRLTTKRVLPAMFSLPHIWTLVATCATKSCRLFS